MKAMADWLSINYNASVLADVVLILFCTALIIWVVLTLFWAWDEFENIGNWFYYNGWDYEYWCALENPYSYASKHTSEKHKAECIKKLDAKREEDRKFYEGEKIAAEKRRQQTGGNQ